MPTRSNSTRVVQAIGTAVVTATLGIAVVAPAEAEDSGFWAAVRSMEQRFEAPASRRAWAPRAERRAASRLSPRLHYAARPKVQFARLPVEAKEEPKPDAKPRDPSERPNPLVSLLADPTLRRGDIVMFPDGPRVFKGQPGEKHVLLDFAKPSASSGLPSSARKVLAAMPVGENSAWSSDTGAATGRIAQSAVVETTGSLPRARRSRQ